MVARTGEGIPTVAVDVDRTLIDDDENLIPGAKEALNYLRAQGWKVILWTSRADLDHVKELCKKYGLEYDHLNENPEADQREYTRKIRFNATVDDKAVPFNGEWPPVVSELDRRRDLWRLDGMTKATVNLMLASREGTTKTLAVFGSEGGRIVERTGSKDPVVLELLERGVETDEGLVGPSAGGDFLRALAGIQGTYLWAEVA